VDSFVAIARAQGLDSTPLAGYERVVQALETDADGKTMTATYRVSAGEFSSVVGQVLTDLLFDAQMGQLGSMTEQQDLGE
jgi:hypothetical protein